MDDGTRISAEVEQFLRAARGRNCAECSRLLTSQPDLLNSVEAGGYGALHFASFNGDIDMLHMLLALKPEVDLENYDGNTPLVMAVKGHQLEAIRVLVAAGAVVNKESASGSTAAHYAASMGYLDCLRLLVELGSKTMHENNESGTLLHWACHNGNVDDIGAMIYEFGIPVNSLDRHGGPALMTALFMAKTDAAEFLIEHGADVNIRIPGDGSTPLHVAAEHCDAECVRLLCCCGADRSTKNNDDKTPLDVAREAKKTTAVRELEKPQVAPEKRQEEATRFKNQGNKVFGLGENVKAAKFYTLAMHLDPSNHVYYSNRAACYFNQRLFTRAFWDSCRCIALNGQWAKGFLRKATSELAMRRYSDAVSTASEGLKLEPSNKDLQNLKDEAFKQMRK